MSDVNRYIITLTGIVQGVGFRPFVFRVANRLHLNGWVENGGSRVIVDVEGKEDSIKEFIHILQNEYPSNATITDFQIKSQQLFGYTDFSIKTSDAEENTANFLPADIAVCKSCIKEFNTLGNNRFQYPFISCTNCGPRYSIISSLPYDRETTSMSEFKMCSQCISEYCTPRNRRFHAQTNCCSDCGPVLKLLDAHGNTVDSSDCVKLARQLICRGKILAVKGIGGYHLCCNAKDLTAVQRLRRLKHRPHKPLAVMARNIESINKICEVSKQEKEILTGSKKPILLLQKKSPEYLPQDIAPNQKRLGIMLPYAPLQFLLFSDETNYLVMTSGNISGSPICYQDDVAVSSLSHVADYFLVHNREIIVPVDDAVVKVADGYEILVRCGRGYAPLIIPIEAKSRVLAVGAEQKCSLCITENGYATVSQYIGNLNEYQTYKVFNKQIKHFESLFRYCPDIYAYDLNADYLSTRYAKEQVGKKIAIQHHHAHMAGCMAENKLSNKAIGVIYDGTGLGTDDAIWGGEFFVGSFSGFKRVGHLKYVTLQGGDSVVREPWRCALSYLLALDIDPQEFLPQINLLAIEMVKSAIKNKIKCFKSSSMGRFFDCVAALCGFETQITYDAQAAIELESIVDKEIYDFYKYSIINTEDGFVLGYEHILNEILRDIRKQEQKSIISTKFHNTLIESTAECVCKIREKTEIKDIVLSGGVFENIYLLERLASKLRNLKFNVYYNRLTPSNDGGISFGQAVAAGSILKENHYVSCGSSKSNQH
ncbi:carbamoyltransferase HypF [Hydrogenoanaerobacterium saccharovorans]|uniref:carbamoyltransferase HypF n=1 Tax=Hydrogenoanaerobacterium saccharovorans TaxID=474960 RepID=UPI0013BEA464|nr:carbamoyltransferase HypF [Hydrogenoanaerobacterium saccharovorans]